MQREGKCPGFCSVSWLSFGSWDCTLGGRKEKWALGITPAWGSEVSAHVQLCCPLPGSGRVVPLSKLSVLMLLSLCLPVQAAGEKGHENHPQRGACRSGLSGEVGNYLFESRWRPGTEGFSFLTGSGAISNQDPFLSGHDFVHYS